MPRTLADLARERLIHLEEPFRPAANWNEWFQSAGVAGAVVNRGLLINDYVLGDPGRRWKARAWRSAGAISPTA